MRTKTTKQSGFTLIELLIVIIIIGILAAIAFVAYGSATSKAHKADAQSTVASVKEKMSVYNSDNNDYPASIGDLDNWLASSNGGNNKDLSTKFVGPGYTYAVTPAGCGGTVAADGTVTPGATTCTGFTLTGVASSLGFSGDVTATN